MQQDLDIFNHLAEKLLEAEKKEPVVKPIPAEELYQSLDISLSNNPLNETEFKEILEKLVLNTPRTSTKLFFNQLFGGRNPKATLGDLLAVLLNNSMYTYKVAGPQVGIEKEIIKKVCELVGFDSSNSDGTFPTGGSMSNYMAMVMARDAKNPDTKYKGVTQKMIAYTSAESHYSTSKNATFCGIGREQVRHISVNQYGQIEAQALLQAIKKDINLGYTPFFVNATAGTTVLGAFDAIEPLLEICKEHNLWLHVDGAYCGSVIFSKKYKHLVAGLEEVNSFSFNAHKMLGTPLTCSILITRHKKQLRDSFSNDAAYLYQTDGDDYNLGKTSLQCGRRNDALKFWTLWKSVGTKGLENYVDKQFELAETARNYINSNPNYTLYSFDNSISVCFNYKGIPAQKLCTLLYEHAEIMVGYGSFNNTEFVRMVTINYGNSSEDILHFFNTLESFVAKHPILFETEVFQDN